MTQGTPGYNAAFYATGTATAMTDEACTEVSGTVFQVTNTAKRIFDHATAVVVKANTVVQSGNYTIDYNFGIVTFTDGSHTGETITVTASYLPRYQIAKVVTGNVDLEWVAVDSGCVGDAGEANTLTIMRFSAGVEVLQHFADVDLFGTTSLADMFDAKTIFVLEYQPSGSSYKVLRARGTAATLGLNVGGPADLVRGNMSFISAHHGAGVALFSYGTI